MGWTAQIDDRGQISSYRDTESHQRISAQEFERRQQTGTLYPGGGMGAQAPGMYAQPAMPGAYPTAMPMQQQQPAYPSALPGYPAAAPQAMPMPGAYPAQSMAPAAPSALPSMVPNSSPLIQPGAHMIAANNPSPDLLSQQAAAPAAPAGSPLNNTTTGISPTAGEAIQGKNLRLEGNPAHQAAGAGSHGYKNHGFLDATSVAILLPTLVLLALIIAAAHKKRLFPWQTIRTFNPPSGLMSPRDYERSYLCPPNLRRHGRLGKRNPNATWTEGDGVVIPFGFLARTHLPITIPMGRLPNKNMFLVAPSGSGKTTLMRAIIKALLAKPSVIVALEAKANDPNLDEKREGFKYTVLPEAQHAGFDCLYFNPLDADSIHWNPLDLDPIMFASSIVQDVNSLPPEEQHWAERDHGYIYGLAQLLKWGAIQVSGEDENGQPAEVQALPCNPRGLMRLVNNRRNIVESLRRLKSNPEVEAAELSELTQTLSSIIRTDTDWDKNIQGVRGRLRMFKNPGVLRCTEQSNIDMRTAMHRPTVLIFGAPASLGPDAESLASCFVYQLQQALHTRYGTKTGLPLFAFFDEYQTLNMDIAGRLSAIVRGANGGLTVILQNVTQITSGGGGDPMVGGGGAELKTIFSNSAIRVCLHNADETTAKFFSEEIGKHAVVVPGISDHYMATGFGIFPTSWNRIHSQQVVARVDPDAIKRMEKHHALVYLSPAGDPEFGEVKPLMVDLRGIEEIARLHLLHNVSARQEGEEGEPIDGGGMPEFTQPGFPQTQAAMNVAEGLTAQAMHANFQPSQALAAVQAAGAAGRNCPHCQKPAGKGKFCIECGQFIGAAVAEAQPAYAEAAAQPQVELNTSAAILAQPMDAAQFAAQQQYAAQYAQQYAAQQQYAQPQYAQAGYPAQQQYAEVPAFAQVTGTSVNDAAAAAAYQQQQAYAQAVAAQQAYTTAVADPAAQQGATAQPQAGVIQGARRQPVTSFNLDPSRLGFVQPMQPKADGKSGVEF